MEEPRCLRARQLSLSACGSHPHTDALLLRDEGFQRAVSGFGTNVPGVALTQRAHGTDSVSKSEPRNDGARLSRGSHAARARMVRPLSEAAGPMSSAGLQAVVVLENRAQLL